jgi:phage virion morphogenesis protein
MQLNVNSQIPELLDNVNDIYRKLGGDLTPLMRGVGSILENSSRDRFRTKTAPDGSSWADLKPSTLKSKKGRGSKMVEYGDLMRSITHYANSTSVAVGSDRPYAKYHQTGTKNSDGSQKMEARPIFGISADDRTDILDLMNDFMAGVVNG